MIRADIISTIGRECLVSNIENDEFSYPKAYSQASLPFTPIRNSTGSQEDYTKSFLSENGCVIMKHTIASGR